MTIIPLVPEPHKIQKLSLAGFAVTSAQAGENVWICVKDSVTAENPRFYVYAEQIARMVFPQLKIATETVNRCLIIVHKDESADVYINNFPESFKAKIAKGVSFQAGSVVYKKDITSIVKINFPGIKIEPSDQVIYFSRDGFRFGIFFNLSREIDLEKIKEDIGAMRNELALSDIVKTASAQMEAQEKQNYEAYIITEGETDWKHLVKAGSILGIKAQLLFNDLKQTRGDEKLIAMCESLSCNEINPKPIICIFDNDNPKIIAELQKRTLAGKAYQDWGHNVYSFFLPKPENRSNYKNISIEMLYPDNVLKVEDKDKRKLYFSNEIEKVISKTTNKVLPPRIVLPKEEEEFDKKVEDQDVSQIKDESGNQVALSKAAFAEQVYSGERPLSKDDVSNFIGVFKIIDEILFDKGNSKQ